MAFPSADVIIDRIMVMWSDEDFLKVVRYIRKRITSIEGPLLHPAKIDPNMIIGPGDMPSPFGTPGNLPEGLNFPSTFTVNPQDLNLYETLLETKENWEKDVGDE